MGYWEQLSIDTNDDSEIKGIEKFTFLGLEAEYTGNDMNSNLIVNTGKVGMLAVTPFRYGLADEREFMERVA